MTTPSDESLSEGGDDPGWIPPRVSDRLDPDRLELKIREVAARTRRAFPDRGLPDRLDDLAEMARDAAALAEQVKGRSPLDFLLPAFVMLLLLGITGGIATTAHFRIDVPDSILDVVEPLDAAVNLGILLLTFGFLIYRILVERRRSRLLAMVHRIRSLVHLLDMIQLTKNLEPSEEAPLPLDDRIRYLDFCSQTASLAGKCAALLIANHPDPAVVSAVTEVEMVCAGIAQKIWAKIAVLTRSGV